MDVLGIAVIFVGGSHVSSLRDGIEADCDTFVGALDIFLLLCHNYMSCSSEHLLKRAH